MFFHSTIVGFTLFAFFFGAGNLIFPIKLGFESGQYFNLAILGFVLTGILMPLIGVIAATLNKGGVIKTLNTKVHPLFSLIFMILIYLTIGPLFAIPRTADASYELGILPILNDFNITTTPFTLFLFTIVFFTLVYYLATNQLKMVDIIGKYLTPILLITLIILFIMSFLKFDANFINTTSTQFNKETSIKIGALSGYQTMDALASIVFATIIFISIEQILTEKKIGLKETIKYCIYASIVAALGLLIVYVGLGWLGNHFIISNTELLKIKETNTHIGVYILSTASSQLLGTFGKYLVAVIVILACLTTAIGLIVAIANYFFNLTFKKFPQLKYNYYVVFFCIFSLIIANQGLNQVIKTSIPILTILYPVTLVILVLFILNYFISIPKIAYRLSIFIVSVISIAVTLFSNFTVDNILPIFNDSFLNQAGLRFLISLEFIWIIPTIIFFIIGYIWGKITSSS